MCPIYLFENESTGEVKEVLQSMNEPRVYFEDGVQWRHVFTVPNAASNSQIDPFSSNQFIEKTGKQKGKMRDLYEQSQEMSERRKQITGGIDPVQRAYFDDYQKKVGKKHLSDRPMIIETKDIKVDFTRKPRRKSK